MSSPSRAEVAYQSIPATVPDDEENNNSSILPPPPPFARQLNKGALVSEFFGTATLVQIGCGANCIQLYLVQKSLGVAGQWQVTAMWMLAAMLGIYMSAPQSGGHLNPAVTLAFALVRPRDFPIQSVLPYWIAQLVGGMAAGLMNMMLFTTAIMSYEERQHGSKQESSGLKSASAFGDYWSLTDNVENGLHAGIIEGFGAGVLCFCIFVATNRKTSIPPTAVPVLVGIAYGLMVALLGPLTGGGINPARDMGPRLVTVFGHWGRAAMTDWFPYILGPLIGGPVGAFLADRVLFL